MSQFNLNGAPGRKLGTIRYRFEVNASKIGEKSRRKIDRMKMKEGKKGCPDRAGPARLAVQTGTARLAVQTGTARLAGQQAHWAYRQSQLGRHGL